MTSFDQAMQAAGLLPRAIVPDGRWYRCPTADKPRKRNGAYVLYPDGRGYFMNWALDSGVSSWRDDSARVQRVDAAALDRRRQAERDARLRAIRGARQRWSQARPVRGLHPYLERKHLSAVGTSGLRVHGEALIVPVFWNDRLVSVQSITPDGQKRFWPGAPVKAGAFVMDRPRAALTAICEGLATGLAVFQCVRMARVIVAFDAGNLLPVVQRIRPTGNVVFCADDDHGTQARLGINPGIEKARNAAELIGAGVAWPEGIEGTDWADALVEFGAGAARRIERLIQGRAKYVAC
ncbi:MAG: toprim domain-containing protein [Gallionellaceae bacterium]|jgi:putative DNA primase/helicase|nr:toprim domain-containing protein [Gallionellaceae bacterium]